MHIVQLEICNETHFLPKENLINQTFYTQFKFLALVDLSVEMGISHKLSIKEIYRQYENMSLSKHILKVQKHAFRLIFT